MPSATATLSLNVSAIKILCRVPAIDSGTVAPLASTGYAGDFYFDYGTEYPIYDLYGPKATDTSEWPDLSASIRIPSVSLVQTVSTTLYSSITTLSANTENLSATSVTITNPGSATALTVTQNDPTSILSVASFRYLGTPVFTINQGFVGINTPSPAVALDVVGNVNVTGSINAASQNMPSLSVQNLDANFINSDFIYSNNDCSLAGSTLTITSSTTNNSKFRIITTNVEPMSSYVNILSAYTMVIAPPYLPGSFPVMIWNTAFAVCTGIDLSNGAIDNFFYVDPTSAARFVTVNGLLTAVSAKCGNVYDSANAQLLTTRQTYGPTLLTQSASGTLIDQWNLLINALTAHGLIR
jgi:hypothetical protein